MSKTIIPTKDNIWNILAETNQRIREHSEENRKRFAETNQQIKALSAETNQEIKALSAENRKFSEENRQRSAEMDQEMKKRSAEWDQRMKKRAAEWDQRMKELSLRIEKTNRGLNNARGLFETQWGKLMESLVEGDLLKILQAQGIEVTSTHPNVKHRSAKDQYEYDILAVNGKEVVGVEVKTTLRVKHVKLFLEELKKFTHRLPHFKDSIIYGAVAFLKAEEESAKYAEKQGLFVIRATGSSTSLINEKGFKPKVFV